MTSPAHACAPQWLPALAAYLGGLGLADPATLTLRPLSGGQSNPTYLLEDATGRRVLRKQPPGELLPSAHAVDREYRVMSALADSAVPVPRMLHYCADRAIVGTPFYLMSYAQGRVFMDPGLPGMAAAERAALYAEAGRVLAALHAVDPAEAGLSDYGRSGDYFARQVGRWTRQYRDTQTEPIAAMDALIDWLPRHIPPEMPARVVHGDYRLDNMILAEDAPRVIAVLDWELSTLGDPLADFAYHLMAWHMPHSDSAAGTATLRGHDLAALGIPAMDDYVEMYRARTGLDPRPHLNTYLAYNFFRIAAILQGIIGRVRDGTATSEFAPSKAEMIRPLAATAWDFARAAGAR